MRIVAEFQIPMPFTSEEMDVGLLYTTVQAMYKETGDGGGTEFVTNEPFKYPFSDDLQDFTSGQYTYKIHRVGDRLPRFVKLLIGGSSKASIHEESWNSHPLFRTVISLPDLLPRMFHGDFRSLVLEKENRHLENVFELGEDDMKDRKIIDIDIAEKMFDFDTEDDPTKFTSVKTGRGPLDKDWMKNMEPLTFTRKLVILDLSIQESLVPNKVKDIAIRIAAKILWQYHRKMFCSMDEWVNLSMDDIRKLEKECAERLPEEMKKKKQLPCLS